MIGAIWDYHKNGATLRQQNSEAPEICADQTAHGCE